MTTRRSFGATRKLRGVVRRRRWSDEEKGRIVAEAIAPDAVIADVAWRHDLAPQHLSNWIRVAKDGQFALPADEMLAFVPVTSVGSARANKAAHERRSATIEVICYYLICVASSAVAIEPKNGRHAVH